MKYIIKNINDYSDNEIDNFYNNIYIEKKKRINNFKNELKVKQSIIGELLLRDLLDKYYNLNYNNLEFEFNKNNKPFIVNKNIFYNISHSSNYVIVVVSDKEIGIDIEKIRETNIKSINCFASNKEKEYILLEDNNLFKRLFEIYTLKEAYIKMMGKSIFDIKNVEFTISNNHIYCSDINVKCYSFMYDNYVISICEKNC